MILRKFLCKIKNFINYHEELQFSIFDIIKNRKMSFKLAKQKHKYFEKYKDFYHNKSIAIVGCGPTVKKYDMSIRADCYIGINRAFMDNRFNFDYIFVQDEFSEGFSELANYNSNCIKFAAIIIQNVFYKIKEESANKINAYRYVLYSKKMSKIYKNISKFPFADLKGTVFSALQFALYTHPKKIFLIGFDCNDSINVFNYYKDNYTYQLKSWKLIKKFANRFYPDVELVSVNPIGLKGLFNDIYT